MKEEDRTKWKSKRLASGDIPSIASIFFIANSTSRRDAAHSTRAAPGTINDSYGIPSGANAYARKDLAINDSDKMNRGNCSRSWCRIAPGSMHQFRSIVPRDSFNH